MNTTESSTTIQIEPFHLIGIAIRTTNENNEASTAIAELWQQFMGQQLLEKIPNKTAPVIYSLYTDYEGDHTQPYTAMLGCPVAHLEDIPEGLVGRTFEGGTYVKTTAKGDLSQGLIVNHWAKLWEMGLPRAFSADFECFGEKSHDPTNAEVDFYIAVQ